MYKGIQKLMHVFNKLKSFSTSISVWLKEQLGIISPAFIAWVLLSWLYAAALIFISQNPLTTILSVFMVLVHSGISAYTVHKADEKAQITPREFLVLKKLFSYIASTQFIVHSITLLAAWSSDGISQNSYYFLYALNVLLVAVYLPVFFSIRRKSNLLRKGIIREVKRKGKTKYEAVRHFRGIGVSIGEWVDAIIWAVIAVIFINSLFFQLYQIPSESMVPEYYVGSRVLTGKLGYNPEIPLSLVRIPILREPKRFDEYVLNNPRYTIGKSQALKDFRNTFIQMITFSMVQIPKTDINGVPFHDPLIKRLTALPGEQIMMVDDIVYIRNGIDEEFRELRGDQEYAWNFSNNLQVNRGRLEQEAVSPDMRALITGWDREKSEIPESYHLQARNLSERIIRAAEEASVFITVPAEGTPPEFQPSIFHGSSRSFQPIDDSILSEYLQFAIRDPDAFSADLSSFLFSAYPEVENLQSLDLNVYSGSTAAANLLFKLKFLRALEAYIGTIGGGPGEGLQDAIMELYEYTALYIHSYFDPRNFAPFPEDGVLPEDQYFFLGDNRYNSFDSRHWQSGRRIAPLDAADPYSLRYGSMVQPFSMGSKYIRGKALLGVF